MRESFGAAHSICVQLLTLKSVLAHLDQPFLPHWSMTAAY
jgi:hypothetical protein